MKLVSVIVPTYKGSECVCCAVDSVLAQTYAEIETIVVDDNGIGTEEQIKTEQAMRKYANNKRVIYVKHEVNKNGSAARNTGFSASKGDYIALLDDDDIYLPEKVETEVDALERDNTYGLVYCSKIVEHKDGRRTVSKVKKSGDLLFEVLTHRIIVGSDSLMIRRELYSKLNGFDESFQRHQDFEFTARAAAECRIKAVPQVGFVYSREYVRNVPKTSEIALEYRAHFIDKMLPLIRRFSARKQQIILVTNALDLVLPEKDRLRPLKMYRAVVNFLSRWANQINPIFFLQAYIVWILRSIRRRISDLARNIFFKKQLSNHRRFL